MLSPESSPEDIQPESKQEGEHTTELNQSTEQHQLDNTNNAAENDPFEQRRIEHNVIAQMKQQGWPLPDIATTPKNWLVGHDLRGSSAWNSWDEGRRNHERSLAEVARLLAKSRWEDRIMERQS